MPLPLPAFSAKVVRRAKVLLCEQCGAWLLFVLLLAVLHCLLAFASCGNLPHSRYNDLPSCEAALRGNQARAQLRRASRAWHEFTDNSTLSRSRRREIRSELLRRLAGDTHGAGPLICTAVVTTPRRKLAVEDQYVFTTLQHLIPLVLQEPDVALILVNTASSTRGKNSHRAANVLAGTVPVIRTVESTRAYRYRQAHANHSRTGSARNAESPVRIDSNPDGWEELPGFRGTDPASPGDGEDAEPVHILPDEAFSKETTDYAAAISACLLYAPRYILVLEDDIIPKPLLYRDLKQYLGQLDRTSHAPPRLQGHSSSGGARRPSWAYLKLYYPEKWSGFEQHQFPALLGVSLLLGLCSVLGLRLIHGAVVKFIPLPRTRPSERSTDSNASILDPHASDGLHIRCASRLRELGSGSLRLGQVLSATCSKYAALAFGLRGLLMLSVFWLSLLFAVGKPNLDALRFLSAHLRRLAAADPCCTPAVLYPAESAILLRNHVTAEAAAGAGRAMGERRETDLFLDNLFRNHLRLPSYLAMPYLVEHIGLVSSLPKE